MKINEEIFSLDRIGLKSRLWVAFTLATFAPIALIFYYIINSYKISALAVYVLISIVLTGWWFVFEAFSSVVKIYNKTRDTLRQMKGQSGIRGGDMRNEVESLDAVFNVLSSKVKESMEELRKAGSKMEELNKAIDQKVKVLSSVLDTSALFSKGVSSDEILQFLAGRLKEIIQAKMVIVFFKNEELGQNARVYYGIDDNSRESLLGEDSISEIMKVTDTLMVDSEHREAVSPPILKSSGVKNFIIKPIYLAGDIVGFVIAGNNIDNFSFSDEMINIISLFSYNMSIVWERQRLYKKVEDLGINDSLTGLYNNKFFLSRLDEEMKRSAMYQRPCGLIVVELANYNDYKKKLDFVELDKILKKIAQIFKDNIRPIDILGRMDENRFGIVVIERNKRQSNYVGTRLREAVYNLLGKVIASPPLINVAVAESPIDGVNVPQLLECVRHQLEDNGT